jgi:hypothetical protein
MIPPLATISDEAMAIAKRAALVVLLFDITIDQKAIFLTNVKTGKAY